MWFHDSLELAQLYNGRCFQFSPTSNSNALCMYIRQLWLTEFKCLPTQVHEYWSNQKMLEVLKKVRHFIEADPVVRQFQVRIACEHGLSLAGLKIDPLRIRVFTPMMSSMKAAAPVYYAHRDTWYANPQAQINVWMPLHDVHANDSFKIYPSYFNKAILNTSASFDYRVWKSEVGWQNPESSSHESYPHALEDILSDELLIEGKQGALWFFSAQHLHQSCRGHVSSRVSIDFRCLPELNDGLSPPINIDNASQGKTDNDFFSACLYQI